MGAKGQFCPLARLLRYRTNCREPHPLGLGHLGRHLAGHGGETALVVPRVVRFALHRAFAAVGADEVVVLFLQKRVQGILGGSPDELFELAAHGILVECSDCFGRVLASWVIVSRQLNQTDGMGRVF